MAYNSPARCVDVNLAPGQPTSYVFEFIGDGGEPAVRQSFTPSGVDAAASRVQVRNWIDATLNALNERQGRRALYVVNDTVARLAPVPPAPSALSVWADKAARLQRAKALGLTNATAVAEIAALEADVNATFVAGYIANV